MALFYLFMRTGGKENDHRFKERNNSAAVSGGG
jgi:hypothetical protein